MPGARLYAVELEAYQAGSTPVAERGHATRARAAPAPLPGALETTQTILASDLGYRTRPGDPTQAIYPPLLERAFEIDRMLPLAPGEDAAGVAWGTLRLLNPDGRWNGTAAAYSVDGRTVRVLSGLRSYDATRGIEVDPTYASLAPIFAGIAQSWYLSETALEVPLRDVSYLIERPLQLSYYLGTGTYEGTVGLTGRPKPKLRGGTAAAPVLNCSPVLIDPTNRIFAFSDGPATLVNIYEGGLLNNITSAGTTTNLYSGTTPAGQYRQDTTRGLFQLGSNPVRPITVDAYGQFPAAGTVTTAAMIARYLLSEDLLVPLGYIDTAAFSALDATYGGTSGFYFDGEVSAVEAIGVFLRGIGAKLVPTRSGLLRPVALRALSGTATPVATYTTGAIVELRTVRQGAPLDPPADRWLVGYGHNGTVQTSDFASTVTDARKQFLAKEWSQALWYSAAVNSAYRRPSRPNVVPTALLVSTDAQTMVDAIGALWGTRRRVYEVTLPTELAIAREIGDVVKLIYPMDDLAGGRLGTVVGEQYRSGQSTTILRVLI